MTLTIDDLKPFQRPGVDFLLDFNPDFPPLYRLLAWDMGLGKTPIAICALNELQKKAIYNIQVLIICPFSLKDTWAEQLVNWGFAESIDKVSIGPENMSTIGMCGAVVINYEQFQGVNAMEIYKFLDTYVWDVIICDESQRLRGLDTNTSSMILGTVKKRPPVISWAERVWFLSGTPTPNAIIDLYPILASCARSLMCGKERFDDFGMFFCGGYHDDGGNPIYQGATNLELLFDSLKPFMYRLSADDADVDLPAIIERNVYCDVRIAADETNTQTSELRKEIGIAKIPFLVEYINQTLFNHRKVVVAAWNKVVLDMLLDQLPATYDLFAMRGGQKKEIRKEVKKRFIETSNKAVLLLQMAAGGEGSDGLQLDCNYLINAQPEWSDGLDKQVIKRLARIGQLKNTVFVDRILVRETQDVAIHHVRQRKGKNVAPLMKTNREIVRMATIEENLTELVKIGRALLEQTGAAVKSGAKAESDEKPAKASKDDKKALTMDDLQEKVNSALEVLGPALGGEDKAKVKIREMVKECGADKLVNVKPAKFTKFVGLLEDLVSETLTADTGDNEI